MITDLIFHNFKCFEDVTLSTQPMTVLAGLNGMGKSSVLQSLLLLHQSHQQSPDRKLSRLVLNGPFVNIGTARDALWEGADEERIGLGFTAHKTKYLWNFDYREDDDELHSIASSTPDTPTDHGIFTNQFIYIGADRSGPRASFPISTTAVRKDRQIGIGGEYAAFYLDTFGTEELHNSALSHPRASSGQLRHQLEAWLGEISPGTRVYTESLSRLDLVSLEYAFSSKLGESNRYRATNVGFGITYILPVVLAALAAQPGSLILLENPEAHLHPAAQLKIGQLLTYASLGGVQILVETHSDHLLNGVRLAVHAGTIDSEAVSLHMFQRIQGERAMKTKVVSPTIDKTGRIDIWPDGFFDETEKALRQLLLPQ